MLPEHDRQNIVCTVQSKQCDIIGLRDNFCKLLINMIKGL